MSAEAISLLGRCPTCEQLLDARGLCCTFGCGVLGTRPGEPFGFKTCLLCERLRHYREYSTDADAVCIDCQRESL